MEVLPEVMGTVMMVVMDIVMMEVMDTVMVARKMVSAVRSCREFSCTFWPIPSAVLES